MLTNKISPFLKWAGGKRQLLQHIEQRLPLDFNEYYEPFIGGGALLFALQPEKAHINDINSILIHTYKTIKDQPEAFIQRLTALDNQVCLKEDYYKYREQFNQKILEQIYDLELACLLVFLNKRCFNGLYRVNSKGLFNVPFNNKEKTNSFNQENILNISQYLQTVEITNGDFEECVKNAKAKDFIFFDSPYAPINPSSFESYTKEGFSLESHQRLANLFKELDQRGCYVMLTNHNTDLIQDLYSDYYIEVINVKRMINRDSTNREGQEVIITNYKH